MAKNSLSNKVGMPQDIKLKTAKNSVVLNGRTSTESYSVKSRGKTHTVVQTKTSRSVGEKIGSGLGVFSLVVGVLLAVSLIRSLMGSNPVTFGGLLEYLSNAPSINMSLNSFEEIAPFGDWGAFNFLSTFFNYFITIFNVIIFAFKGLGQVIVYVVYFVKFLFF